MRLKLCLKTFGGMGVPPVTKLTRRPSRPSHRFQTELSLALVAGVDLALPRENMKVWNETTLSETLSPRTGATADLLQRLAVSY